MSQHIIIDNKAIELRVGKTYLEIRHPDTPITTIPFRLFTHLTITCDLKITTNILHRLCNEGITVTLLSGVSKYPASFCYALTHGNHARRLAQYKYVLDHDSSEFTAQKLLEKKLIGYIRIIRQYIKYRDELNMEGNTLITELKQLMPKIEGQSLSSLLGLEGFASKIYFQFYSKLMPPTIPFDERNKRPPKDPINALLSLTYSLFTTECSRALEMVGLDPAFGVYHQVSYQRASAACDLVELFRPHADFFVWRLVAEQHIKAEHFVQQLNACTLNKIGKKIYFTHYFNQLSVHRRRFYRYARNIVRVLETLNDL